MSMSELARSVRDAQRSLGSAARAPRRTAALRELARILEARAAEVVAANEEDLAEGRRADLAGPLMKRLVVDAGKLATLREGVLQVADMPDPIGGAVRRTELDDGLTLKQVRAPLGVLLIIFESRPEAVIQIGSLAIRSGNGLILKGGSEATHSNRVLTQCLRDALAAADLPADAITHVEGREAVAALLDEDHFIDLVIPRGSGALVRSIQESSRIPVLGHAEGICHLYLDAAADPEVATRLAVDGKCDYPAACNATETLLVHAGFLPHLPAVAAALRDAGVELRGDARASEVVEDLAPATEEDWRTEYGDLVLAIRVVDDLGAAIDHIHTFGSGHTDAICSADEAACARFLDEVDAASVFVNASTRFADGFRYGLGAEVGISTGRIHARGPVGVEGLLTTRWLLEGRGQVAADYGPGKRTYTHRVLPLDE